MNYLIVRCSKSESVAVAAKIANPKCPSCGHTMRLTKTMPAVHSAQDHNVFQCPYCKLTYMTEDHLAVNGQSDSIR